MSGMNRSVLTARNLSSARVTRRRRRPEPKCGKDAPLTRTPLIAHPRNFNTTNGCTGLILCENFTILALATFP